MDCEQIEEQLEAYALGALDWEEAEAVAAHLVTCTHCQELAGVYADVAAMLPGALAAVSPAEPPHALKQRLLQRLEDSRLQAGEMTQTASASRGRDAEPVAFFQPARKTGARRLRLALIAAGALLILLGVWSIRLQVTLARERSLRAEFAELVDRQELVLEVIDSNQTQRRVLRSPVPDSRAYGKLFTRDDMVHVVAMAARLAPPSEGQGYHLWTTQKGETSFAGLLNVNDEGFGLILFDAAQPGPVYESAEVTLQPLGAGAPAGPIILRWDAEP